MIPVAGLVGLGTFVLGFYVKGKVPAVINYIKEKKEKRRKSKEAAEKAEAIIIEEMTKNKTDDLSDDE